MVGHTTSLVYYRYSCCLDVSMIYVQDVQARRPDHLHRVDQPGLLCCPRWLGHKGNLPNKLPKYRQFIKCQTREENTLDHCYTTVSPWPRGWPDSCSKPVNLLWGHLKSRLVKLWRTFRRAWTIKTGPSGLLPAVWMRTWRLLLHTLVFCEEGCVPSRTRVSYTNDKTWFTARLRQLRWEKE